MHIVDLDEDTAALILQHLAPSELGRLTCVSRWFRKLCQKPAVWKLFCRERWTTLTPPLVPDTDHAQNGKSWRGLYSSLNGWRAPAFRWAIKVENVAANEEEYTSSMHAFSPTALGWQTGAKPDPGDTWLALTFSRGIQISTMDPLQEDTSDAVLAEYHHPQGVSLQTVAALPNNAFAAGADNGNLYFFKLDGAVIRQSVILAALIPKCVDIQVCLESQRLYTMHDGTRQRLMGLQILAQRNVLQQIDLERQKTISTAHEFSEHFELVCFAAGQGGEWGNELYAGAVHGRICGSCARLDLIPALCYHKAKSATAALCVFDLRAPLSMVQRYGTHHRSLYPRMCSAGGSHGSYLFTSHVKTPLCCWDKRNMSLPVHESQQLGSHSRAYPPMPLPPPHPQRAAHSAMWLECDPGGDLLVGRAENGMMWRWDLTATLGWQAASSRWHGQGSWLTHSADGPWEEGGKYFQDWPQPMGAWPADNILPGFHIDVGAKYQLIGLCSQESPEVDWAYDQFVACAALDGQMLAG